METQITIGQWKYVITQDETTGLLNINSISQIQPVQPIVQQPDSLALKALQYAKAEASRVLHGPVSLEVIGQRKAACEGCEGCDKRAEGEWYCDRCGCPKWKRSQLQVKWEMPAATCPLGKWPQVG